MSDAHILSNRFLWNTLYSQYLRENGITYNFISHCAVLLSVSFDFSSPIFHNDLKDSCDNDDYCPLDWDFFACGTS